MTWVPTAVVIIGTVAVIYIVATIAAVAVHRHTHDRRRR